MDMGFNSSVEFVKLPVGFNFWTFDNILSGDLPNQLLEDSNQFNFFKLDQRRTSRPDRIYMHEYNIDSFKTIVDLLTSNGTKKYFSDITGIDYTRQQARIELCKDATGSWLEQHCDDPAKTMTCQIYLSNAPSSTKIGTFGSKAKFNCGWVFSNTGTEPHGLPLLTFDRTSIILNYVSENWRDREVLI